MPEPVVAVEKDVKKEEVTPEKKEITELPVKDQKEDEKKPLRESPTENVETKKDIKEKPTEEKVGVLGKRANE